MKRFIKVLVLDIIGVLLIVISPLLGWVPGPGGIPIFLAGLGLLSINHTWARRLLLNIKSKGLNLLDRFFVDHTLWKAAYDFISFVLIFAGLYLFIELTGNVRLALALLFFFTGLALFLGNRQRLQSFTRWLKRHLRKA